MRKSKFSESQIVSILKDAEGGAPVADVKRLRELEAENRTLQRRCAELALYDAAIKVLEQHQCRASCAATASDLAAGSHR